MSREQSNGLDRAARLADLEKRLRAIEAEMHATGYSFIQLHQQTKRRENLSFSGGLGRIYVNPVFDEYDISLSGKLLIEKMFGYMTFLCGSLYGNKQTKPLPHQPFWRVSDFSLIKKVVEHYSKL
jgi:hypothetical protein